MQIKLLKKGIRIDGVYYPVWYSSSDNSKEGYGKGNATIYCKDYGNGFKNYCRSLPVGLQVQNDSEIQTDYIEKDRIRVSPGSVYFEQVETLARGEDNE